MRKLIILFCLLMTFQSYAQSVSSSLVSSAGGSFYQIYAKMDWAIGETVIETYNANNNYMTHGFIQGSNTSLNSIDEKRLANISLKVFPNPFKTELQINFVGISNLQKPSVQIFNILGMEVYNKTNLSTENKIELNQLSAGIYLLKVEVDNQLYQTYRIEKVD